MSPQKLRERKARIKKMNRVLTKFFPDTKIALTFSNNWELLVAVELSAQCTDTMVNKVTEKLFKKYRTLDDYLRARPDEFAEDIRSTGFYKNKAKNILAAARKVKEEFGGEIPDTMDELLTIPGVARKTANVLLGNAFGKSEGIAVDTHVRRFAIRFDLSDYADPVRIERDLIQLLPRSEWNAVTYRLIDYGRAVCPARKHDCAEHPLTKVYPPAAIRWPKAK
jgi:endonuclease-3